MADPRGDERVFTVYVATKPQLFRLCIVAPEAGEAMRAARRWATAKGLSSPVFEIRTPARLYNAVIVSDAARRARVN